MSRTVCVMGAGIVGAATALALSREGWQVTVVDAESAAGRVTSFANGGQLSYSYVEPMATPSALADLPAWMLKADSPVRWRPRIEVAHARWLMDFMRACTWPRVQATTESLLALSFLSRRTLHAWLADVAEADRANVHHARPGKLVIYRDATKRESAQRQLAWQSAYGCTQRLVEPDECRALEPSLAATGGGEIAFGVWTDDEEVVDAAALSNLLARHSGATLRFGQRIRSIEADRGRIRSLKLESSEALQADHYVLAAGPASGKLARPLGLRLALEPIKGYSITLPIANASAAPTVSITDHGRRMVHARLGDKLRTAGFAELTGFDTSVNARRIEALRAAVAATFPGACRFDDITPWAGLRPATPSGLPMVSGTRFGNLWLNTGHGGLGLTLAAGSAVLLAALMAGRAAPISAAAFNPD